MARISLFQSAALAVLAAVGTMIVPAQAQDADRQEWRAEAREARQAARAERQVEQQQIRAAPRPVAAQEQAQPAGGGRNWNRGAGGDATRWQDRVAARQERQAQQQVRAAPQVAAPQQQAQPRGGGRNWDRGVGGDATRWQDRVAAQQERQAARREQAAPEGGWRSQRAPDGQRYGRNWDNRGTVERPAPAVQGAIPPAPERGTGGLRQRDQSRADGEWANRRNRTYGDPDRNGGYGDRRSDRAAHDGRNRQVDRDGSYRNGYRADAHRDRRDQRYSYRNGYDHGYSSRGRDHRRWDRNHWRRDNRYNWSSHRYQHRDLYRVGRYYSPYSNYRYSRLSIGFFLDSGFYGNRYWIGDPWQYRLPEVYGPYRWVRYYDDVLLVDIYSGEVVDVIYDFFW